MAHIVIGKSGHKNVGIDLQTLLSTRLLIQADSGGGKTYLLRVMCEQAWGKIQVIIVDPEGEFATLREKFGYVLVGKDGDTPADPRSAALLATRLLELRASAICDLYEMKPMQRHEWVQKFLDALIDAPKNLWHPVVVIVDEAHMFCPENGKGESVALDSMIALCTRGRKRGFCAVFATQRLSNLSKSASGMLLNRLIGPTFESGNITRAADELAIPKKQADRQKFIETVKLLEPGNYYALGRAISRELILMKVNQVQTTHLEVGVKYSAPPPPPANVAKLLPKLSDLPKEAEEKARTEAELRAEIRTLKQDLRAAKGTASLGKGLVNGHVQKELAQTQVNLAQTHRMVVGESTIRATLSQEIEPWKKAAQGFRRLLVERTNLLKDIFDAMVTLSNKATKPGIWNIPEYPVVKVDTKAIKAKLESQPLGPVGIAFREIKKMEERTTRIERAMDNGDLTGPERKILIALAKLRAIGKDTPPKAMVAGWAGYSPEGGAFGNPIGSLRTKGFVRYPAPATVQLTAEGLAQVGEQPPPESEAEIQQQILGILTGPERKILSALLAHGRDEITKPDLAAASGYGLEGGAFGNPMGALRTKGFLTYPRPGIVKAADWLFFE